jgi:putative transposase
MSIIIDLTPDPLGDDLQQRYKSYQKIFDKLDIAEEESLITEATLRGEVYGTYGFHHKISQLISRATKLAAHGGDRKSEAYKDHAG